MTNKISRYVSFAIALGAFSFAPLALAQPMPSAQSKPSAQPVSSARPTSSAVRASDAGAPLSKGDAGATSSEMPHNHPSVDEMMGRPRIPTDSVTEDSSLPAGTIIIDVRNAAEQPMPNTSVTLGKMTQSIAKGESREHQELTTDANGRIVLQNQPSGSGMAYRVTTRVGPATFAARPFNLPQDKGMRVVLHRYETTTSLEEAVVLTALTAVVELRDDRIQIDEVISVFNRGRNAWVPDNVIVDLPPEFTALVAQQAMSDQGVDPVPGKGARLKGTFPPGQHQIEFRWQLPYSEPWKRFLGEGQDIDILLGVPPHTMKVQAVAAIGEAIKFSVDGFPAAVVRFNDRGDRMLVTQRELQQGDSKLDSVTFRLANIPGPGRGPLIATLTTLALLLFALYAHVKRDLIGRWFEASAPVFQERDELLAEAKALEEAHAKKEIGPKTYERARREIVRALARLLGRTAKRSQ